ncbi:DUF1491 family protein [Kordiimonas sp. SCSIO 12610]|uniref:DUF1491 family protein n=1 Tax=Kordiimonas sp. SCSIO 12610 TaxID=2829597 RepID=UPI00210DA26C|nr:DUF1491 family protein [Kordiimonas sp. SCSIO 12610]UTW55525.1 DUF1491 family protein [Kordiimonas sp. SCSIO 12610]
MEYPPIRLASKLWIDAHIRACFGKGLPAFVVHKGDVERGGVIIKVDRFDAGILVFERTTTFEGDTVWAKRGPDNGMNAQEAQQIIDKRLKFDSDCWVVEIEDMRSVYHLE